MLLDARDKRAHARRCLSCWGHDLNKEIKERKGKDNRQKRTDRKGKKEKIEDNNNKRLDIRINTWRSEAWRKEGLSEGEKRSRTPRFDRLVSYTY